MLDSSLSEEDFPFLQDGKDMIDGQGQKWVSGTSTWANWSKRGVAIRRFRGRLTLTYLGPWEWLEALGCP